MCTLYHTSELRFPFVLKYITSTKEIGNLTPFLAFTLVYGRCSPYGTRCHCVPSQLIPSNNHLPPVYLRGRLASHVFHHIYHRVQITHTPKTSLLAGNGSLNYLQQVHWSYVNTLQPAKDRERLVVMNDVSLPCRSHPCARDILHKKRSPSLSHIDIIFKVTMIWKARHNIFPILLIPHLSCCYNLFTPLNYFLPKNIQYRK